MSFDYEVMTEKEAMNERYQLLKDGEYDAVISKIDSRVSPKGNPMFDMQLQVYNNGSSKLIRDFLVFNRNMMWKVIHCAESAQLIKEYESRKFSPELLLGKNCKVRISSKIGNVIPNEKLNGKPPGSRYPDQNVIEDYIVKNSDSHATKTKSDELPFSDDLPF